MINEIEECRHGMPDDGHCFKCQKEDRFACKLSLVLIMLLIVISTVMSFIGE